MILFNCKKKLKLSNKIEKYPNFGMKDSKMCIACTKSLEVNIQIAHHFDFKYQRLLLKSIDLLWRYFNL